ncbi:hypothetical protein K435DRAFT_872525 [Dendrothele bispora CBS 962.96]|uniref:F-box domain-containing protein n=1 Tax=Dendrothele bispora (strain CBS 962.96) TaxID=1314807 RepID=A0A4S8L1F3_DENBC|nr:hypothetical protein K435DRAFT_872525 [Dendrothele bispora CBS 962.96]
MAHSQPADVVCAVIDLSDQWRTLTTVSFARSRLHACTVNDLHFDAWAEHHSSRTFRLGISGRRIYCERAGPHGARLTEPFSFIFGTPLLGEKALPDTGHVVVAKHGSDRTHLLRVVDVCVDDLATISQLLRMFNAIPHWALSLVATERVSMNDRRFLQPVPCTTGATRRNAVKSSSCRCAICLTFPPEISSLIFILLEVEALASFLGTCRCHYHTVAAHLDYRICRYYRRVFGDSVPIEDIKSTLRTTGAFIHGSAVQGLLLNECDNIQNEITIATPFATRTDWLQLLLRIPDVMSYHFKSLVSRVGGELVERIRTTLFLPNGVIVTIQESSSMSAFPLLLTHGITSMACGISYSSTTDALTPVLVRSALRALSGLIARLGGEVLRDATAWLPCRCQFQLVMSPVYLISVTSCGGKEQRVP